MELYSSVYRLSGKEDKVLTFEQVWQGSGKVVKVKETIDLDVSENEGHRVVQTLIGVLRVTTLGVILQTLNKHYFKK